MKSLQEYLKSLNESSSESKSFTFNFDGLEGAEDVLKSLEDKDYCTVEDNKLSILVNAENCTKFDSVQDILQQFCSSIRNSQKRSSNEEYAQKTVRFEKQLTDFNKALDELENPDEDAEDENKKEDE